MPFIATPNDQTGNTPESTRPSVAKLPSLASSNSPEVAELIAKGKEALRSLSPSAGELLMLGLTAHDLEQMISADFAAQHKQLQRQLNPALCAHRADLPSDFHSQLFTKLNAGASEIVAALDNPLKRNALFQKLGYTPTKKPEPVVTPDLSTAKLPPPPVSVTTPSPVKEKLTDSKPDEPNSTTPLIKHQNGRVLESYRAFVEEARSRIAKRFAKEQNKETTESKPDNVDAITKLLNGWRGRLKTQTKKQIAPQETNKESRTSASAKPSSSPLSCKIATFAKITATSSVGLFAGMHAYGPHRDEIRRQVPNELKPTYDVVETALYGTYRAERAAVKSLMRMLDEAVNGTHKK
jgi:hypothetical protein